MKYEVLWDALAEADLAAVWLAAADRNAVTRGATWFDEQLGRTPYNSAKAGRRRFIAWRSTRRRNRVRRDRRRYASRRASSIRRRLMVRVIGH